MEEHAGILLPPSAEPVPSRLIIEFHSPTSAEFKIAVEGVITPAQKFVAAGWLASILARDFVFAAGDPLSSESTLTLDFGEPGRAKFTPTLKGQMCHEQLYSAAGWVRWAADLDFTANAQRMAIEQQQALLQKQQIMQGLSRSRVH